MPNASKLFGTQSLDAIRDRIDKATSDKQDNLTLSDTSKTNLQETNKIKSTNLIPNTNSSVTSVYQLAPQFVTRQNYTGQIFAKTGNTCQISVPELAQTINGKKQPTGIVQLDNCSSKPGDPVQVVQLTTKPNSPQVDITSGLEVTPYSGKSSTSSVTTPSSSSNLSQLGTTLPTLPPYYDTIKLTISNQGTGATLNFEDSSGKTKSVLVTMKNSDSTLFSGTFYSSKFTADVKDVPDTPHIIEMTIDNTLYGTLHASAYAPSNMQNSTITGILSQ